MSTPFHSSYLNLKPKAKVVKLSEWQMHIRMCVACRDHAETVDNASCRRELIGITIWKTRDTSRFKRWNSRERKKRMSYGTLVCPSVCWLTHIVAVFHVYEYIENNWIGYNKWKYNHSWTAFPLRFMWFSIYG